MVGAMGPAVSGVRRSNGLALTHLVGLLIGSAIMGLVLILLGSSLDAGRLKQISIIVLIGSIVVVVLQLVGLPALQSRWQVPEHWRRLLDMNMLAAFYGFLLGFGAFTAVVASAFWVFLALSLLVSPPVVIGGWLGYAAVRGTGFFVMARLEGAEASPFLIRSGAFVVMANIVAIVAAVTQVGVMLRG
jgi:hypothetical protein